MVLDSSATHALPFVRAGGHCFHANLLTRNGDFDTGLRLLRTALEQGPEASSQPGVSWFLGELAEGLGRAGQIAQGLEAIDKALARSERNEERWCVAELLRIRGELLLLQDAPEAAAAAEDHFGQALDWACRQGALAWELRAATSLARLLRDQGRSAEALALLQPVYDRFAEGFETVDLKAAKHVLDMLAEPTACERAAFDPYVLNRFRRPEAEILDPLPLNLLGASSRAASRPARPRAR
jgi:predicted ATPase